MISFRNNKLFAGIEETGYKIIHEKIQIEKFSTQQSVFKEGEPGKAIYLIGEGQVSVCASSSDGNHFEVAVRTAEDFIGEMALIDDSPRSASIIAKTPCVIGRLEKSAFDNILQWHPKIGNNILKTINERLRESLLQQKKHFLEREENLKNEVNRLQALFELTKIVQAEPYEDDLFRDVPLLIQKLIPAPNIRLWLWDEKHQKFYHRKNSTLYNAEELTKNETARLRQQSVLTYTNSIPASLSPDDSKGCVITIKNEMNFYGLIIVNGFDEQHRIPQNEAFLTAVASYIAVVVQNIHLFQLSLINEKLSAVGRAAGSVFHDYKNLLSTVNMNAQLILHANEKGNPIDEYVKNIVTCVKFMAGISKEVLSYVSGERHLAKTTIKIGEVFQLVSNLVGGELKEKGIRLEVTLPYDMEYTFDHDSIGRALYNLVLNACQASQHGGTIALSAEKNQYLSIVVSDNGSGIDPSILPDIFKPFVTTKKRGTGLGLSIVKNSVEAHQGTISVSAKPNGGTIFEMRFPV